MRRWILYAAVAAAALALMPGQRTDIGELLPVEALCVYRDGGKICVEADTGDLGVGADLDAALEDLRATAEGKIFLETADYLIITDETRPLLPRLVDILRPGAEVCLGVNADAGAVAYLRAHSPGITLNEIRAGDGVPPTLIRTGERYHFASDGSN